MKQVPFLDLKAGYVEIQAEIEDALLRASRSGWYIGGTEVELFEQDFANYTNAAHCVGVGNGFDALCLALRALDIEEGDEVIVPSHTFIATWLAVNSVGATLVPVEPSVDGFNIDIEKIEMAITSRTKAILPVHLYGTPVDMDALCAIAKKHHVYVVEDAAQAHGATVRGKPIGSHGDVVAWSFYPGKNLGALGDGGAVTTNHQAIAERVRMLGNYGSSKKYYNEACGMNSRLDPMQAATLSVKLKYLPQWNARRVSIAKIYDEAFQSLPLNMSNMPDWGNAVRHLYVITSPQRGALQSHLSQAGIQTIIHYPVPPHLQKSYQPLGFEKGSFPIAERYANEVLSLPIGPQLGVDDAKYVAQMVGQFFLS